MQNQQSGPGRGRTPSTAALANLKGVTMKTMTSLGAKGCPGETNHVNTSIYFEIHNTLLPYFFCIAGWVFQLTATVVTYLN